MPLNFVSLDILMMEVGRLKLKTPQLDSSSDQVWQSAVATSVEECIAEDGKVGDSR